METKTCNDCGEDKELNEFNKAGKYKDGSVKYKGKCKPCRHIKEKLYRDSSEINRYQELKSRDPDKLKAVKKAEYEKNKDGYLRRSKKRQTEKRDEYLEYQNNRYQENKAEYKNRASIRRTRVEDASLGNIHKSEIIDIYRECESMMDNYDIKYQVDHIIPLQGRFVSGLHVPNNLQILTEAENRSKTNKFDGTYDNESWRKEFKKPND